MILAAWHDLFITSAGAASALAGLIIVALSVNLDAIITIPSMTSRAATTIAGLTLLVVIACTGLIPTAGLRAFGTTTMVAAAIALALAGQSATRIARSPTNAGGLALTVGKAALGVLPAAALLAAGVLLCCNQHVGLDLLAAAIIAEFAAATTNAWVLLVEIRR